MRQIHLEFAYTTALTGVMTFWAWRFLRHAPREPLTLILLAAAVIGWLATYSLGRRVWQIMER